MHDAMAICKRLLAKKQTHAAGDARQVGRVLPGHRRDRTGVDGSGGCRRGVAGSDGVKTGQDGV